MQKVVAALAAALVLSHPVTAHALAAGSAAVVAEGSGSGVDDATPEIPKQSKKAKPLAEEVPPPAEPEQAPPATNSAPKPQEPPPAEGAKPDDQGLNFDLNVTPKTDSSLTLTKPVDTKAIRVRRTMLVLHQTVGILLTIAEIGTIITGQLNYDDKFQGANSAKYEDIHTDFAWPTEGLAAVTAGLAIFAPVPIEKENNGFDRMTLHKIGEFAAFAGWAAEAILGPYTASREGYQNQYTFATAHLAVGYLSLAGMLLGVGAIVF